MTDTMKSGSLIEADLRAKIKRLEAEVATGWSTPIVAVSLTVMFMIGALIGMIL